MSVVIPGRRREERKPAAGPGSGSLGRAFVSLSTADRIGLICAGILYVLLMELGSLSANRQVNWLFLPAVTALIAVEFWPFFSGRRAFGWFHPVAVTAVIFGTYLLRCFGDLTFGLNGNPGVTEYSTAELDDLVLKSIFVYICARLCYYCGYYLAPSPSPLRFNPRAPKNVGPKCVAVAVVAAAACMFYVASHGGLTAHLAFLAQGRSMLTDAGLLTGEWTVISSLGGYACVMWVACDDGAVRKVTFWAVFMVSLVSVFIVANARSESILCAFQVFAVWTLKRGKLLRTGLVAVMLAGIVAIGILGDLRARFQQRSDVTQSDILLEPGKAWDLAVAELSERAGKGNPIYPMLARVPSEVPLLYGSSYLVIPAAFIPRALWQSKPRSIGVEVGPTFLRGAAPVPPGAVGEAFWNFHYAGVIGVFLLFGIFHHFAARTYLANLGQPMVLPFYVASLIRFSPDGLGVVQWLHAMGSLALVAVIVIGLPKMKKFSRGAAARFSAQRAAVLYR